MAGKIKVKLIKSTNRRRKSHKACVTGLGLKKIGQERELADTPEIRGMVNKVFYMVQVEEI